MPWSVFGNATAKLSWTLQLDGNLNVQGGLRYSVTTGLKNNGDGDLNHRPYFAPAGTPICFPTIAASCAYATQTGLFSTTGAGATLARNAGNMP